MYHRTSAVFILTKPDCPSDIWGSFQKHFALLFHQQKLLKDTNLSTFPCTQRKPPRQRFLFSTFITF